MPLAAVVVEERGEGWAGWAGWGGTGGGRGAERGADTGGHGPFL